MVQTNTQSLHPLLWKGYSKPLELSPEYQHVKYILLLNKAYRDDGTFSEELYRAAYNEYIVSHGGGGGNRGGRGRGGRGGGRCDRGGRGGRGRGGRGGGRGGQGQGHGGVGRGWNNMNFCYKIL
jgi:hypothetical protein